MLILAEKNNKLHVQVQVHLHYRDGKCDVVMFSPLYN